VIGLPLSEVNQPSGREAQAKAVDRKATNITLVRSRIFYSKAALNARGLVRPGFKHIRKLHVTPLILSY
jgi:telomerase reverse transcriptase